MLSNSTVYLCLVYLSSLRPVFRGLACAYVSMLGVTVASRAEFSMNLLDEYSSSFLLFDCCWLLMSCVDALMRENFSGSRAVLLASAKICHNDERSVGTNKSSIVGNNTFT